jgi:phage tail tape-measure protein
MATEDYALATGSGALSGAAAGAAFGPWGAAGGALIGGALGYFGQSQADKQEEEAAKLARKQRRREKNLRAKQSSVERRALAQKTETSSRGAKSDMTIPSPSVSTSDLALTQAMAVGTGSPFDTYIIRTYGQPQGKVI